MKVYNMVTFILNGVHETNRKRKNAKKKGGYEDIATKLNYCF